MRRPREGTKLKNKKRYDREYTECVLCRTFFVVVDISSSATRARVVFEGSLSSHIAVVDLFFGKEGSFIYVRTDFFL